jgi:glucan phosphoethanolaminetransferase (alkaline phosphatase superfamily)
MRSTSVQWPLPAKVRMRWDSLWHCRSETRFAVGLALIWTLLYSHQFWTQSIQVMWHPSPRSVGFMISLFLLVVFLQALPLLLMPTRALMRATASLFFLIAAASSHFAGRMAL